jgi:16S rRNA processing protein RimM
MKRTFESDPEQLSVAKIGKTVGLDGKLKLHLTTDFPEQFKKGALFYSFGDTLEIESYEATSSVVKFKNFNTVDASAKLTNRTISTTLDSTRQNCKLGKDEFFWFDIVGLEVVEAGEVLGVVESIERYNITDYLSIKTNEKLVSAGLAKSFLLPYQDRFVVSVSLEEGKVNAMYAKDILTES